MKRGYTKVQELAEVVFERKANGETNRAIAESLGLSLEQIRNLVKREIVAREELPQVISCSPKDDRERRRRRK